jgi:hypothetical protein
MKHTQTFLGQNSDSSKQYLKNTEYIKAINFRPTTTLGGSTGSLVTVQGNQCAVEFPSVRSVYKLRLVDPADTVITVTVNGQTTSQISLNANSTVSDILTYIQLLPNCFVDTYNTAKTFTAIVNNDELFIYQLPIYTTCDIIESTEPVISPETVSGGGTLQFVDSENNLTTTSTAFVAANSPNDPLVVIGSTYVGSNTYMLTCGRDNTERTGQLWLLEFDDTTQISTLKLLYNNYLALSIEHGVPPTAFVGRYEIPTIERVYWSDFNNPVRSVNAKDPNLMGVPINLIDAVPSIEMSIPTLADITTGAAVNPLSSTSTYQMSYRLKKANTSLSNFSIPSSIVVPVAYDTDDFKSGQPNFSSIDGTGNTINKSITWRVGGIDTSFDIMECYIIVRSTSAVASYSIFKYEEIEINGSSELESEFTNDEADFEEITMDEFLIENGLFTHAKTLEQKDNRLFYGNVKNGISELVEAFDSRAFRFNSGGSNTRIRVYETDATPTTVTITTDADYANIDETADNIPVYNLGMDTDIDADYSALYRFKKGSTDIGGTGKNVSFSFGTFLIKADETSNQPATGSSTSFYDGTARDVLASSNAYKHGYRKAGTSNSTTSLIKNNFTPASSEQEYTINTIKETMALEFLNGQFRGYQLNEIYRFAIVFQAKNGSKYFAKHIADIKFPDFSDSIPAALQPQTDSGTFITDFRTMHVEGTEAYLNIPYITFDITIPDALAKVISGYQIVRTKRTDNDKTINSHGLITQVQVGPGTQSFMPIAGEFETGASELMSPDTGTIVKDARNSEILYQSFDCLIDKDSDIFETSDRMVIHERYRNYSVGFVWPRSTANAFVTGSSPNTLFDRFYKVSKLYSRDASIYTPSSTANNVLKIVGARYVEPNGNVLLQNGNDYTNRDFLGFATTGITTPSTAAGSPTMVVCIDTSYLAMTWANYSGANYVNRVTNGPCKLLATHFKPTRLKNQYGGRTNVARANSEYISCGAFYKTDAEGATTTIKVLGGDTFYGVIDNQKAISQYDNTLISPVLASQRLHAHVWFFPTMSTLNIDTRIGIRPNSDLNDDTNILDTAITQDTYNYNQTFSIENELHTYIPKPLNFNSTTDFFNRIYWSSPKINGETLDSWVSIATNDFYDVDGNYGEINALITLNSLMYFVQRQGFGVLEVNPSAVVTDQNAAALKIATGEVLSKHYYKSVDIGSRHQWSISKSINAITFVDAAARKIYTFDGSSLIPISDVKNNRGFINKVLYGNILGTDNPLVGKGILTTYDYTNNEFLYTFLNDNGTTNEKYTLVFSNLTDTFTHFVSATPYIYINNHRNLYSLSPYNASNPSKLYIHNKGNYGEFYDEVYPSSLKLVAAPNPIQTKVFDNISWSSESTRLVDSYRDDVNDYLGDSEAIPQLDDTISNVRVYTEYQNSDWVFVSRNSSNLRRVEQEWNIQVPRNKVNYDVNAINTLSIFDPTILTKTTYKDRMRDKYLVVDLRYDNSNNNKFTLHNLSTLFRVSDR